MNPAGNQVQLTEEDILTLKRCRQISFWRGSVPFTVGALVAVTVAQRFEFFAKRPKLRIPAYVIAGFVGFFGGKLAYLGDCKRMFLELNDSRIKDQLLQYENLRGFGYGPGGFGGGGAGAGMSDNAPIIVNTPVDKEPSGSNRPMTYAERREFYRNQGRPSTSPPSTMPPKTPFMSPSLDSDAELVDENLPNKDNRSSYFDQDKPTSSFLYDDIYRPRD